MILNKLHHTLACSSLFLAAGVCGSAFAVEAPAAASPGIGAHVVSVSGQVVVGKKNLSPGDAVLVGEKIETRANSELKIVLADGSIVDLKPLTVLTVESSVKAADGAVVTAKLDLGTVRSSIQKKYGDKKERFFIRTKASVLAVRGTEFVVSLREGAAGAVAEQVTVSSGEVFVKPSVGNLPGVSVPAGTQFSQNTFAGSDRALATSDAPKVVALGQGQATEIVSKTAVEDKTFNQAVTVSETAPTEGGKSGPQGGAGGTLASLNTSFSTPPAFQESAPPPVKELPRPDRVKGIEFDYTNNPNQNLVQRPVLNVKVVFAP